MRQQAHLQPPCIDNRALFQSTLFEGTPATPEERTRAAALAARAASLCQGCPMLDHCLYTAVVKHEVAGFVAGTTPSQRRRIRRQLGVTVAQDDLDAVCGLPRKGAQVSHEAVLSMRRADPTLPLGVIAMRLGCSLSTVKRHLRRDRSETPEPATPETVPSLDELRAAARIVVGRPWQAA